MQKDVRTSRSTCTSFGKDTYHCSFLEFGHVSKSNMYVLTSGGPYIFLYKPPGNSHILRMATGSSVAHACKEASSYPFRFLPWSYCQFKWERKRTYYIKLLNHWRGFLRLWHPKGGIRFRRQRTAIRGVRLRPSGSRLPPSGPAPPVTR